ncbi:FabD/lysophospholipase-like protein [Mycena venus]|uniref:FabD/lysophospholipase-like protein n=1 Tax=Mycena venus TaxID=2733690 RepID=A0A8H6X3Q3_9AGAR|nr:FabD/lysophospholipase-like protein [Mycena venus]
MSTTRKPKDRPTTPQRSSSRLDWLGPLIVTARAFAAGTEALPIPYIRAAFGSVVVLLETVERVKKNRNDLEDLCKNAIEIMAILQQITLESHANYTVAEKLENLCWDFHNLLQTVVLAVEKLQSESLGVRGHVKEFLLSRSISEDITRYQKNVQELGLRIKLVAAIDTNVQVHKIHQTLTTVIKPNLPILQATEKTNTCPPPSRIFQGREVILDKMHHFFTANKGNQHIYVLHGLGGVGKTQIALKFIKELSSDFSDRFFVDTSTNETIDAGLKKIAVAKCFGNSAKDGLLWLTSNVKEWLLFFDNADDPTINLNAFIPQCDHGNIIITSRNPGLCIYAGAHSQVSDMNEEEALALLLRSAAQGDSLSNCQIAAEIVKV